MGATFGRPSIPKPGKLIEIEVRRLRQTRNLTEPQMDIPIVIFKDAGSVYGVSVPDIKGVHSWGRTVEAALENVKDAITTHICLLYTSDACRRAI